MTTDEVIEAVRLYALEHCPRTPSVCLTLSPPDRQPGQRPYLSILIPLTEAPAAVPADDEWEPSDFQQDILAALDGKALRTDPLGAAVGDRGRLFKPRGLKELRDRGLIEHDPKTGFFRPDAPPQVLS